MTTKLKMIASSDANAAIERNVSVLPGHAYAEQHKQRRTANRNDSSKHAEQYIPRGPRRARMPLPTD